MFDFLKDDPGVGLPRTKADAEPEALARRASETILGAVALLYPLWHWIFLAVMPAANDPLAERLSLSAISIVVIVLSRLGLLRGRSSAIEQGLLFLMTGHYLSMMWRNDFAPPYVVGLYVVIASCSVVLTSLASAVAYSTASLVGVALLIGLAGHAFLAELEWFLGMVTVLVALCIGANRTSVLRRLATNRLFQERRLLKHIIDAIPDPVFVRNFERDLVLTNQAGRQFDNATGFDLAPVVQQELSTLSNGQPVEADTEVVTNFGRMSVSVKTAQTEFSEREKMVITVMRDVTDRRTLEDSLRLKIQELEEAHQRVRQLQGMLPICMHCSRIRTKSDEWETLETFVVHHSDASFTHTLCATCLERHYPS